MYETIPYTPQEAFNKMGYTLNTNRDSCYIDCPKCGGKKKMNVCTSGRKAHLIHCAKCGWSGNTRSFIKEFFKEEHPDTFVLGENKGRTFDYSYKEEKTKTSPIASIEKRNKVYETLFKACRLSNVDYEDLKRRGLTDESIRRNGYCTLYIPDQQASRYVGSCVKHKVGESILGVPATYEDKNGNEIFSLVKNKCCVIRYKNRNNLTQAVQLKPQVRKEGLPRYYWYSSNGYNKGVGGGNFVHYATDFYFSIKRNKEIAVIGDTLYITEGALKGDIAHQFTHAPFICVAGVNNIGGLKEELDAYKGQVKDVICCYDMDYIDTPEVAKATETLKELIKGCGYNYYRLMWDSRYKGIDDFCQHCNGKFGIKYSQNPEELICKEI